MGVTDYKVGRDDDLVVVVVVMKGGRGTYRVVGCCLLLRVHCFSVEKSPR